MTAKKVIIGAMLTAALWAVFYEAHRASTNSDKVQALQQERVKLAQEIEDLVHEREDLSGKLRALRDENERLPDNRADLGKMRQELARLQRDSLELARLRMSNSDGETDLLAKAWVANVKQLKQRLAETPGASIPELQLLNESDWLELARTAKLDSETGYRRALGEVRKRAEGYFTKQFQGALNTYMGANDGRWPADLDRLKPYFDPPVDDVTLQRWAIVPKTALPGREFAGDWIMTEKSPVDPEFDHR
jgi:hypothetical protein